MVVVGLTPISRDPTLRIVRLWSRTPQPDGDALDTVDDAAMLANRQSLRERLHGLDRASVVSSSPL